MVAFRWLVERLPGWQVIHSQAFILATHFLFVHCIYHPINKRSKACDRVSLNIGNMSKGVGVEWH